MNKKQIITRLEGLRGTDPSFRDGRILSSVSTEPLDVALDAFRIFSDTNALDLHIFSSVEKIEREVIGWFGDLLNNPQISGYVTTGGTEANMAALYAAKRMYPKKREIIVPESAHYSIARVADLMDLRIRWAALDGFKADVDSIKGMINENTLAVVATAGTSALGVVDPIEEINDFCTEVFFHVDAAFGGFVLPFLDGKKIDFTLSNIDSFTIDPHKMGMAPIPAGSILFRDDSYLDKLKVSPPYLPFFTSTLSGSRSGGAIAATWATLMYHGFDGYKRVVGECMENTGFLCNELKNIPHVGLVTEPEMNIVGIKIPDMERVTRELRGFGWRIAVNRDVGCIRVAVMPHVTREVILEFLGDLKVILRKSG
ncbi:MAG: tyrosine decarboxylase MfnA [Candidatus Altiarchaeota archaeon]|nr:tyrosine decarboxylase MfnA [Candidatus Altiarchaeota archaeon]